MNRHLDPHVQSALREPILFRTVPEAVYAATVADGSIWLRSDTYFRTLEDKVRSDPNEGTNSGTTSVPLRLRSANNVTTIINGEGSIGNMLPPHYIFSMHGSSISTNQLREFGGHTFGIKNIVSLAAELLYKASLQVKAVGYRYGQVYYQRAALSLSDNPRGGAPIELTGPPNLYLKPLNMDVLRKSPVSPFVEQDEWRVVVFVDKYLNDDPNAPLKLTVSPDHFYPYTTAVHT